MFCSKCGKEVHDDWNICPNCGNVLKGEQQQNIPNGEVQEPMPVKKTKKPLRKRWWFWVIVAFVVFFVLGILGANLEDDTPEKEKTTNTSETKEEKKEETQKETKTDFSEEDFESLIGKSEKALKKEGLEKDKDSDKYQALKGDVVVTCSDGKVSSIVIKGDADKTPAFCGVRVGMAEKDAVEKIQTSYSESKDTKDGKTFMNLDAKESVSLTNTDGKVSVITYQVLSDKDVEAYKKEKEEALRAEYIFPDSDKKYLSEDEVRKLDADKLALARNEIYARHGYIFADDTYKQYFAGKSWYKGTVASDQFQADSVFNDYEKKNVELIKKVEDELNGPSAEELKIQEVQNMIVGRKYHLADAERTIEFSTSGELIYSISSYSTASTSYTFSCSYENVKDDIYDYIVFINIGGVEYYFREGGSGMIQLNGDGEFDGWYEPL